jgi:hypothetical protein
MKERNVTSRIDRWQYRTPDDNVDNQKQRSEKNKSKLRFPLSVCFAVIVANCPHQGGTDLGWEPHMACTAPASPFVRDFDYPAQSIITGKSILC